MMIPPHTVTPAQPALFAGRKLVWYSHGATSAVMAKLMVEEDPTCIVVNCSATMANEHPDNERFMADVADWIGQPILQIYSPQYADIYDVFDKTGWLVGPAGARCTKELKIKVREKFQTVGDVHHFGFTSDESGRVANFVGNNPELYIRFPLIEANLSKVDCLQMIASAGIELPAMYRMGYHNNNCIGCVKGGKGYWRNIREDFPDHFRAMVAQERKMNARIFKDMWLDELPSGRGAMMEPLVECGITCDTLQQRNGE